MGIRLEKKNFEFNGKTYVLTCNMNVLADLQEMNGGELPNIASEKDGIKVRMEYLAAMMNDYADEMGWPERYTGKTIGRKLKTVDPALMQDIQRLVIHALFVPKEEKEEQPKN